MSKYKIDDWVKIIGADNCVFHILGVSTESCYAGIQTFYLGRIFYGQGDKASSEKLYKYSEIELGRKVKCPT